DLLGKLRKGELSEVERQQLAIWRAENERNEELYTEIAKDRFVVSPILQRMLAMDTEEALMRLKQIRANREQAKKRRRLWWRSGSVAAALIAVFVILFLTNKFPIHLRHAENLRLVKTDTIQIVPG